MKLPMVLWLCFLGLCACTSAPTTHQSVFPEPTATTYKGADGSTWVVHEAGSAPDGSYWMRFTPHAVEKKEWKELLGFGLGHEKLSQAAMRKNLDALKVYDSAAAYTIEGSPESFVVKSSLPRYGEKGVTRVVRSSNGYYYVSYQERLGEAGADKLKQWTRFVLELSDQALLPESVDVISRSDEMDRQPR